MKRAAFFLLSLAFAIPAGATAQAPDVLQFNGKTYAIHTNPLTPLLAANPGRLPEPEVVSSGLWRGYIATWAVRDGKLFLEDVQVPTNAYMDADAPESEQFRSAMEPLFEERGPQIATWFTGRLIVPTGEIVDYVHMGYASTYASYLIFTVRSGVVDEQRELNREEFEKFRRRQYKAFKKTPEYATARAEVLKADKGEPTKDELLEQFLFEVTSEEYLSRIFEDSKP